VVTIDTLLALARSGLDQSTASGRRIQTSYVDDGCLNSSRSIIFPGSHRVRYPQWFLLLVAVLGILSGCRSSSDLEAFAKRHR